MAERRKKEYFLQEVQNINENMNDLNEGQHKLSKQVFINIFVCDNLSPTRLHAFYYGYKFSILLAQFNVQVLPYFPVYLPTISEPNQTKPNQLAHDNRNVFRILCNLTMKYI